MTTLLKAHRIRIYPTAEQREYFVRACDAARGVCPQKTTQGWTPGWVSIVHPVGAGSWGRVQCHYQLPTTPVDTLPTC